MVEVAPLLVLDGPGDAPLARHLGNDLRVQALMRETFCSGHMLKQNRLIQVYPLSQTLDSQRYMISHEHHEQTPNCTLPCPSSDVRDVVAQNNQAYKNNRTYLRLFKEAQKQCFWQLKRGDDTQFFHNQPTWAVTQAQSCGCQCQATLRLSQCTSNGSSNLSTIRKAPDNAQSARQCAKRQTMRKAPDNAPVRQYA